MFCKIKPSRPLTATGSQSHSSVSSTRLSVQREERLFVWAGGEQPGREAVFGFRLQLHNGRKAVGEFALGTRGREEEAAVSFKFKLCSETCDFLFLITSLNDPGFGTINPGWLRPGPTLICWSCSSRCAHTVRLGSLVWYGSQYQPVNVLSVYLGGNWILWILSYISAVYSI